MTRRQAITIIMGSASAIRRVRDHLVWLLDLATSKADKAVSTCAAVLIALVGAAAGCVDNY